jgi:hypothetical protein
MLPRVLAESASYLGWLGLLLKLIDLPFLPGRLTVYRVLESFDHGLEMLKAFLQDLETRPVLVLVGIGSEARFPSDRADLNHAFEHPRETPCPLNW